MNRVRGKNTGIRTEMKRMFTNIDLDKESPNGVYAFEDAYDDYEDDRAIAGQLRKIAQEIDALLA